MPETDLTMKQKIGSAVIWILIVLEILLIGGAGVSKFVQVEMWTGWFSDWGYPIWFTFVVGVAEAAAALLLLFPRLAAYAAGFLVLIMLGAVGTLLTNPNDLGLTVPILHLVVLGIIMQARWSRRLR